MATAYSIWSVTKLTKERDKIDKAIERKSGAEKKLLIAKVKKMASDSGFDLAEFLVTDAKPSKPTRKKRSSSKKVSARKKKSGDKRRGPVPQNFRNPDNHDETWSGRGRPPSWAAGFLNAGWSKEDLRF